MSAISLINVIFPRGNYHIDEGNSTHVLLAGTTFYLQIYNIQYTIYKYKQRVAKMHVLYSLMALCFRLWEYTSLARFKSDKNNRYALVFCIGLKTTTGIIFP